LGFIRVIIALGVVGGVIVSLVCAIQIDMKSLVAYSSVVHIGILLGGISTFMVYGFQGALAIIVGHGAVSSGLFFLVGRLYDRFGRRTIFIRKGLAVLFPSIRIM
jgi:NADH:ubiquinone oxidoreductase subunit 4 (subunit M)